MLEPTLYERLGGVYAISAVVDHFSDQLVQRNTLKGENPQIEEWNAEKAAHRLPGLRFLRTLWVCAIAGGPFQYTGQALGDAHFDFRLAANEFDEVAAVLAESLDHFKVPSTEKQEVLDAFASYKPAVTGGLHLAVATPWKTPPSACAHSEPAVPIRVKPQASGPRGIAIEAIGEYLLSAVHRVP